MLKDLNWNIMNNIYCELKKIVAALLLFAYFAAGAQVGIGTTNPNPNALLDVDATSIKGGVLMPRVALISTISPYPLVNHVAGMTLYNTSTVSGTNNVSPGYYYNNGIRWLRLVTEADVDTKAWGTEGNAGTTAGTNFIGTTDNQALNIRTNNLNSFRFTETGSLHSYSNGTAALPSFAWNISSGTGLYYPESHTIGFSTYGGEKFRMTLFGQLQSSNDGIRTAPSFSFLSSPRSGMFMPSTNVLSFSTNGTERLRIPNQHQIFAMNGGTATQPFYSWNSTSSTGMFSPQTNNLAFSTNGTERMRINTGGNIGIRTTAPTQALHVVGNTRLQGALMPNNNSGTSGQVLQSAGANNSPTWGPTIRRFITNTYNVNANSRRIIYFALPGLTVNDAVFATIQGSWDDSPRVSIDYVEARNGQLVLVVSNNTGGIFGGGTNYLGMAFVLTVIQY